MLKQQPGALIVLALFSLFTRSGLCDQLESSNIPDMLLASLARAKVDIAPVSLTHALATHAEPRIRGEAADVLGLLKVTSARLFLHQALEKDPNELVRQSAALALARLGDEAGLAALKNLFFESTEPVQQLYLAAQLAELGEPDGFSFVAEAAASKKASARSLAAQFLAPFVPLAGLIAETGRSPGEILLALADDQSPDVRLTVVRSLSAAVLKGMDREAARATAQRLADQDLDPLVREAAKRLLDGWRFDDEERARRKADG